VSTAPASVAAGHYYQGRLGQRFWGRLRRCGLFGDTSRYEDDAAVAAGFGFTDVVKRSTVSAKDVTAQELRYGASLLDAKLKPMNPPAVVCVFKGAAEALLGKIAGYGWIDGDPFAGAPVFVMPPPYEATVKVDDALRCLRDRIV